MKKHLLAGGLAIVCGLIVGLPHLLIPRIIAPNEYDPLQFTSGEGSSITMEEVYTYVPEVREILEGKFWVTDAQVSEYNGRPTPFAGETGLAWVMAMVVKLTGSMENAFLAADFLFPAVTFLLVYAIVMSFVKNSIAALASGAVVVLWPEGVALIPYPKAIVAAIQSSFNPRDFLFISRNFHPQLSLPAYLGALLLTLEALRRQKGGSLKEYPWRIIPFPVLAGVAVGFLFYTYIFNWTAFGLGLGLTVVLLGIKRSGLACLAGRLAAVGQGLNMVRRLLVMFAVAGLVAAPYFFQIWQFRQSGLAADFFQKLSLPKRDFFDLTARHLLFLAAFAVFKWRRWRWKESLYAAFWLAPLLMPVLAQAIFSRDLEGKHWVRRIGYPMSIMGLGLIADDIRKKWVKVVAGSVLVGVFLYGLMVEVNMSRKAALAYAVDQDKNELYDWINKSTPTGSVILSLDWDSVVNIPAKSHAFNFSPIGMRTIAPTDEALDRFLWAAAIYGADEEWVRQAFVDSGIGTTRTYYFTHADENQVFNAPAEIQGNAAFRYRSIREQFLAGEKPPYRLDYILMGPVESKLMAEAKASTGELPAVFQSDNFRILQFN